ncbi:DNA-binding PadR family transcriptional regulator [Leifsonia sp. AK011]|uniref:PadR family transcriptional regulator n=1 Tax=Leifsonia sp. AK011 TaxID=2723075 RepID=UPI0015CD0A18|nr:PadR family transcriptional regulator [Leifsonia sp. AK011]NYF09454.1 DNA-binding PadR family transcriptional regulator [Leifsonia sp. AK011]
MTPPVFAHGHLRLYLLSLLAESGRGMHGYELIQALGDRFGGTYVPSAGTIYPRLGKLEEEGLVTKVADGRKTVYEITDAGRAELEARASELDGIENGVTDSVRRLADEVRSSVNDAMRSLRAELAAAAREAKAEARYTATVIPDNEHIESRTRLQEAEALLAEFRASVRSELRMRASRGDLTAETVAALREGLDAIRGRL